MPPASDPEAAAATWPALVLTAGLGTRLHPLSGVRAKPAVPVAGIPLAGRVLRWLAEAGVHDAVLNLHHRPDTVTHAVGDGSRYGVRVRYSWEPTILGSAGGPARALPLLDAPRFFLVNGDTLTDVDLRAMARRHVESGAAVTMALVANPDPLHYGGVVVAPDGAVIGFSRRGPENPGWHFVGVQVVDADVFAPLNPDRPAESVSGLYRDLIRSRPGAVQAYCCDAAFHDIGTAADYLGTSLTLAARESAHGTLTGYACAISPRARIDRSVIWDRVTVAAGVSLTECVVADDVEVPPGLAFTRRALVRRSDVTPGPHDTEAGSILVTSLDAYRPKD
ncbi:MAG: NDP-sugar synthase [Vicinamibacterales bacterium]|nr:NDP-sugar synthase [Vicinamibacterales bacterium]